MSYLVFVKLGRGQKSDQYFMLASLSDSTWISDKLIAMHMDKKSAEKLMES